MRRWIAAPIRRLVIGAVWVALLDERSMNKLRRELRRTDRSLTIAIDGTMSARLLAITFDFLPPAFITRSGDSPTFLHW